MHAFGGGSVWVLIIWNSYEEVGSLIPLMLVWCNIDCP